MARTVTCVLLCIASAVGISTGAERSATREVRCAEVRFAQSVERGDLQAFRAAIDPDARFIGATVQRGADEVVRAWSAFFAPGGPKIRWRPRLVEVLPDGKLALTRGPFRLESVGEDGEASVLWGTFNSIWRLDDEGRWRVVFDSGDAQEEPPSAEVQALLRDADPAKDCK